MLKNFVIMLQSGMGDSMLKIMPAKCAKAYIQDLCSLQHTVQTNQIVELFYSVRHDFHIPYQPQAAWNHAYILCATKSFSEC